MSTSLINFFFKVKLYSRRLSQAIQTRNYEVINRLLREKSRYINRNYKDRKGNTLIHLAVMFVTRKDTNVAYT